MKPLLIFMPIIFISVFVSCNKEQEQVVYNNYRYLATGTGRFKIEYTNEQGDIVYKTVDLQEYHDLNWEYIFVAKSDIDIYLKMYSIEKRTGTIQLYVNSELLAKEKTNENFESNEIRY